MQVFGKMTSCASVFSASLVSTVDTCTASVYGCLLDVFPTFSYVKVDKKLYSIGEMTSGAVSIFSPYSWFDSGFNFMRQFTESGDFHTFLS